MLSYIKPFPAIIIATAIIIGILSTLPAINKKPLYATALRTIGGAICLLTGIYSGIMTLLSIPASTYLVGIWGRSTLITLTAALILFIVAIPPGIYSIRTHSLMTELEEQQAEIDSFLMENDIMPIKKQRQKKYIRKRRTERAKRPLAKNQLQYNHIGITDEIEEQLQEISIQPEEDIPVLITELAWKEASEKNPGLDWKHPTVPMTKQVYRDAASLQKEVDRLKIIKEQENTNEE